MSKININYEKVYFYITVLFAFTMPLSRALVSLFVLLLGLIWLYEGDFKRKYEELKQSKLFIALSLFIAYNLLSIFFSTNILEALNTIRLKSYWIVIFVIMTSIKKEKINSIITAFLMGMFISEILAYGIFFEFWSINSATAENPSPFMYHIDYSVFLAFASLLLLNRIISNRYNLKDKFFIVVFFCTVTGNLFLAAGRTGQVALIVGIIIMTILHFRVTVKSFLISLLLITTIFTAAYNLSDTFQQRAKFVVKDLQGVSNLSFYSSLGLRAAFYITSFDILKEHPFGVGIGDFHSANIEIIEKNEYPNFDQNVKDFISDSDPHNQYLLILLQMGFVGLILFIYIIYAILTLPIKDEETKEVSILFVAIFFTSCMAEVLLSNQFSIALFVLFVGLFGVASKGNKSESLC